MWRKEKRSKTIPGGWPVCVVLVLVTAGTLGAADPPHWTGQAMTIDCSSQCHTGHQASGSVLTASAGNVNLCQSCHNPAGLAGLMPVSNSDLAVPGIGGSSHAFDVPAVNPGLGTLAPLDGDMSPRVIGGNIVCSTCHDQHRGIAALGGTPRVRPAQKVTVLGSTGDVTSGGTFSGAAGLWYLVEITTAGDETGAKFRFSKDNGISWTPAAPGELDAGTDVALDNGVEVSFGAGGYALGERWELAASWPFLRVALDSGANGGGDDFCRDCHRSWVMTHGDVETYDGSYKSHPVGIGLDANGRGYDRPTPLDGNGAAQGGAGTDSNASNDLNVDASGNVQCLTCHGMHYADSNTETIDGG